MGGPFMVTSSLLRNATNYAFPHTCCLRWRRWGEVAGRRGGGSPAPTPNPNAIYPRIVTPDPIPEDLLTTIINFTRLMLYHWHWFSPVCNIYCFVFLPVIKYMTTPLIISVSVTGGTQYTLPIQTESLMLIGEIPTPMLLYSIPYTTTGTMI